MAGLRPIAFSLQRLFSGYSLNGSKEEFENCIVHNGVSIRPLSPTKAKFKLDQVDRARVMQENQEFNQLLDQFLEEFKPVSPKKHSTAPVLLNHMHLMPPGFSSLKKRRSTLLLEREYKGITK